MKIQIKDERGRIDAFLAERLDLSRSKIQKLLKTGKIKVNDEIVKNNYEIKENDEVVVSEITQPRKPLQPQKIALQFIYEDDHLLVVNKPKGLIVHPGAGNEDNTLVNALLFYEKQLSQVDEKRPGIVHRLDADTSGLLLIAKTDDVHFQLVKALADRKIKRTYRALVWGVIKNKTGSVDAPIGRDPKNRQRYAVTALNSKVAKTHFRVLARYEKTTLLEITIDTGRTHQIRVHMQYIKHPIVNEPIYSHYTTIDDSGQCLHAYALEFQHPVTGEAMHFTCPEPDSFQQIVNLFTGGDNNAGDKNEK